MPISLFKYRAIQSGAWQPVTYFMSSGTGSVLRSKHLIRDLDWYHAICDSIWQYYFGPLSNYEFLGLLPHYSDNPHSSLLSMVSHFMFQSSTGIERYYLQDKLDLYEKIEENRSLGIPTVLFGVSFALIDYGQNFQHTRLDNTMIIETGGMKKYHRELTRAELHSQLQATFGNAVIASEYGMAECTSQLYSQANGLFKPNPWMKIVITETGLPFDACPKGTKGRINIIDLGNVHSCGFIATDDLGVEREDGCIEILGRLDNSDLRGCNYL